MSKKAPSVLKLNSFHKKNDRPDFYIKTFQEHKAEHPLVMEPHSHDFYLITVFTKGTGSHTIDFKTYRIKPGKVFFMSPGQMHSWNISDDADGYVLFFNSFFYMMDREERRLASFPFYNTTQLNAVALTQTQLQSIRPLIQLLEFENREPSTFQHSILRSLLDALLYKLFSYIQNPTHQLSESSLISKLELLLDQYFKDHKPVSFYAEHLHISVQKLNLHTRGLLNKTVSDLLNERLMIEAKRLLIYTDKSVGEIAYELNFNDNSYFNKFFKRMEKETPDQFRKRFI